MRNPWRVQDLITTFSVLFLCVSFNSSLGYQGSNYRDTPEFYQEAYEYGAHKYGANYNPYHDERIVDSKGRYAMEWTVDYKTKTITFNLTVETTGWVGVGFSKDGTMKNADIMMGWVGANGRGYLRDLHANSNRNLFSDTKQNWGLLAASEYDGVTNLVVNRPLDTCDSYDYPVTIDLIWVLWAYGETDKLEYHFDKRGSFRAFLLDPVLKSFEPHMEFFRVANEVTLSKKTTSYMCSIHKGPHLLQKHHMVEFHPYFQNDLSMKHTHHLMVWQCAAPPGNSAEDIFEDLVGFPGEECYFNDDHVIPIQLCRVPVTAWSIGGNPFILPYSTGIQMGESFNEYYMLEVHFDNPESLNLELSSGMDIYYTDRLRANDGGSLIVSYDLFGLFMIPPVSTSFKVYGFCTEDCSQSIIPESGFEIIATGLHTHYTGRRVKLQHFRNGTELEWIIKDDNYDSTFQQGRLLYEPRLVLPGDLLVLYCEYDSTERNVTTVSGFSTREEMCLSFLTITKRVPYFMCVSQVPAQDLLSLIGVQDYEWDIDTQERIVTAPPSLAGEKLSYVTDTLTDWTKSLRYRLQEVQLTSSNIGSCPEILLPTPEVHKHSHQHHHKHDSETKVTQQEPQQLQGTIISSSADAADILTLAKGYGDSTLMGEITKLPNRMPGPFSSTNYPYGAKRYEYMRTCPRINTAAPVASYYSSQNYPVPPSSTGYQSSYSSSYAFAF